ncbi:ATP-binding protein [Streptomyces sp. NPDC048636]|uniref:AAA family ATPase n=1 Tax=Streptomyces sp. NPDC048636 TaxID=3155762 RepID=UPI0034216D9F
MSALPGAGKTSLARALEQHGFTRLCPDEEMWLRYGHYGTDFPRGEFKVREAPVLADLAVEFQEALRRGEDVVFDHGWWTPEERASWQRLAIEVGVAPLMVYLNVSHETRWARIQRRNARAHADANAISFTESDLRRYEGRFISPSDTEPHIVYDGNPASILFALAQVEAHPEQPQGNSMGDTPKQTR